MEITVGKLWRNENNKVTTLRSIRSPFALSTNTQCRSGWWPWGSRSISFYNAKEPLITLFRLIAPQLTPRRPIFSKNFTPPTLKNVWKYSLPATLPFRATFFQQQIQVVFRLFWFFFCAAQHSTSLSRNFHKPQLLLISILYLKRALGLSQTGPVLRHPIVKVRRPVVRRRNEMKKKKLSEKDSICIPKMVDVTIYFLICTFYHFTPTKSHDFYWVCNQRTFINMFWIVLGFLHQFFLGF